MKNRSKLTTRDTHSPKQRLTYRTLIVMFSLVAILCSVFIFILSLSEPKQAFAVDCNTTYSLDWGDPTTYTITCGTINSGNWTVKGDTCVYSSPVLNVGGVSGDPSKTIDLSVRINQSGNLTDNDFAWVYAYINGSLAQTYVARGDTGSAVFSVAVSIVVPAGGNFQISAKVKSDKTNEFWQIKNGEVTACIQNPITPLPVTLTSFTGNVTNGHAQLKWTTASEVQNDYFTVLRSSNGTDYADIGRIKGNGTTSVRNDYFFTDDQTPIGLSYYRLWQTDYDGKKTEYGPIVIRRNDSNPGDVKAAVSPNPFTDHFNVIFTSSVTQDVTVNLYGLNGALLDQKKFTAQKGANRFEYESAALLPSGVYLAGIEPESGSRQFLKLIHQ